MSRSADPLLRGHWRVFLPALYFDTSFRHFSIFSLSHYQLSPPLNPSRSPRETPKGGGGARNRQMPRTSHTFGSPAIILLPAGNNTSKPGHVPDLQCWFVRGICRLHPDTPNKWHYGRRILVLICSFWLTERLSRAHPQSLCWQLTTIANPDRCRSSSVGLSGASVGCDHIPPAPPNCTLGAGY